MASSPIRRQLSPGSTRQALTDEAAARVRRARPASARPRPRAAAGRPLPQQAPLLHVRRGREPAAGQAVRSPARQHRQRRRASSGAARQPVREDAERRRLRAERIDWFNGGLFDDDSDAATDRATRSRWCTRRGRCDWAEIEPAIFGTLFERGLDPDKRSQLGAHYTDRDDIMLIVEPVIIRPWLASGRRRAGRRR